MSFNTALSGLSAAQSDLSVTSNNIANVSTTGFKKSRAEFGDIYATSAFGASNTAIGSGVILQSVAQQFTQGNMDFTTNTLDFAVGGEGFFVLSPSQGSEEKVYSRAGAFGVDNQGNVVNSVGQSLQVFPVNPDGSVTATSLSSTEGLKLPESAGVPEQTSNIAIGVNLPADATDKELDDFDPSDPATFSASTSVNIYDSLGNSHVHTMYFIKDDDTANSWAAFNYIDGQPVDVTSGSSITGPFAGSRPTYSQLIFGQGGKLDSTIPATVETLELGAAGANLPGWVGGPDGTQTVQVKFDASNTTQFASPFTTNALSQDGFSIGRLTGLNVSDEGVVSANYSNGQTTALGKIALARFPNPQGLSQISNTAWAETTQSGEALAGEAGTSSYGNIKAGALEISNVDLTKELVSLITAQRNFQANAKSIETSNAITQTIIQIR